MKYGRKYVNDYKITFNNDISFIIDSVIKENLSINNKTLEGFFIYVLNESDFIETLSNFTPTQLDIISLVRDEESGNDINIKYTIFYPIISYVEEMNSEQDMSYIKIIFKGTLII